MTNDIVQVQYESLDDVARRFAQQAAAQAEVSRAVAQKMAPLRQGGWIGRGSEAFFDEMQSTVVPSLQWLVDALHAAAASTRQIQQSMRDAEDEAARLFQVTGAVVGAIAADASAAGLDGGQTGSIVGANATPPPRVYIVNGINSLGNEVSRDRNGNWFSGDDQSVALKHLLEQHGFDPGQVKTTPAVYLTPHGTTLTGTSVTGTHLGGWLSPVDWLTNKAAAAVNTATAAGADAINSVTGFVLHNSITGSVTGSLQTAGEYVAGEYGPESRKTYAFIQRDLQQNPLLPGQSIVLVGHSGGGAIVTNLAGMIERNLGQDVRGVVTAGSPLANYSEASRYAEYVVEVKHQDDWVRHIGVPVLDQEKLSAAPGSAIIGVELNNPASGPLDAHGSYMYSRQMAETLRRIFPPGSRLNPI